MPVVISAAPFEVSNLRSKGFEATYLSCGIGALEAARCSRDLGTEVVDKDVIFVGTCGIFGRFDEISLVSASEVVWSPPCERAKIAWSIEGISPNIPLLGGSFEGELPRARVLCSSTISRGADCDSKAQALGPCVENLELYSIVGDLLKSARSLSVVLGVTNAIGEDARRQWRQNFKRAASLTASFLVEGS